MDRGQSGVMGIVLLFGMVILGATVVFSVGLSGVEAIQDETESEHDLLEMQNIAHEIRTLSQTDQTRDVGITNTYRRVDGGHLVIEVDGDVEYTGSMGRLVKDDLVYEGGLVIEDGRVRHDSVLDSGPNPSQITLPTVTGDSFSGNLQSNSATSIQVTDPTANVTVRIRSAYAATWAEVFQVSSADVNMVDGETVEIFFEGGAIPEPPTVSDSNYFGGSETTVTFGDLSVLKIDSYESSDGEYSASISDDNAIITSPSDLKFAASGGGVGNTEFDLNIEEIRVDGTIQEGPNLDDEASIEENADDIPSPTPTSEIIDAQDPKQGNRVNSASIHEIENGGEFHTTGDLQIQNDLDLENDVSLFIDGDVTIDGSTITPDQELRLFVTGDVTLNNGATIATAGNPHRSSDVRVFTTGDINATSGGGPGKGGGHDKSGEITGLVHGTDSTLTANGQLEIYGSITIGNVKSETNPNEGGFILHFDEDIAGSELYETVNTDVTMEAEYTRDAYYLGLRIPEIEVD